jgi:hypothetical protein
VAKALFNRKHIRHVVMFTMARARCKSSHDPSTPRPDAPDNGAKEKIGPLRSG